MDSKLDSKNLIRLVQKYIISICIFFIIYFSPTDIEIRVNKEVVYTKPIERLLGSLQGAEWLSQLILKKQAFRGTLYKDEHTEAEPHGDLDLISYAHHGTTYKNGELRRKLLQGANFHCAQLKSRRAHTVKIGCSFDACNWRSPWKRTLKQFGFGSTLFQRGQIIRMNASTVTRQTIQHIVLASKSDTEPCMKIRRRNSGTELQRKAILRSSTLELTSWKIRMKIGWLSNHGGFLIEITAARGSRHHTQVELYEPELKVRP